MVAKADGSRVQETHYYPFVSSFAGTTGGNAQPYKYNNKEFDQMHDLNRYDYSTRYYESAIGRFTSVDPLAKMYYSWSPYVYVKDNPLKYTDPTGMYTTAEWMKDHGVTSSHYTNIYKAPESSEVQRVPGGPMARWMSETTTAKDYERAGKISLRYFTPIEDIYGVFAKKNFEGKEYNRGETETSAAISIIPITKFGKVVRPLVRLTREAAEYAAKSLKADHVMRDLVKEGILKGKPNSKAVTSQWV